MLQVEYKLGSVHARRQTCHMLCSAAHQDVPTRPLPHVPLLYPARLHVSPGSTRPQSHMLDRKAGHPLPELLGNRTPHSAAATVICSAKFPSSESESHHFDGAGLAIPGERRRPDGHHAQPVAKHHVRHVPVPHHHQLLRLAPETENASLRALLLAASDQMLVLHGEKGSKWRT